MATITLNANYGKGEFKNLGLSFNSAKQNTSNLASSLQKLKNKVISVETVADAVAIGKPASTTVKNAEKREENKKSALSVAYEKLDQLLSDVGSIDDKVAGAITASKKAFYKEYSWLKPECEKGVFEKIGDRIWGGICAIGKAIKKIAVKLGKWLKEHWKELLIGLAAIVVGAILIALTAGTGAAFWAALGPALLKGFVTAVVSGLISGAVSGTVTLIAGLVLGLSFSEAFKASMKAFGDGFASGFMSGGIGFCGGAFGQAVGGTFKTYQALQRTAKVFDYASKAMDIFEYTGELSNKLFPGNFYGEFYNKVSSNPHYQLLNKSVGYCSTFFGSASKQAKITDDTFKNPDGTYKKNVTFVDRDEYGLLEYSSTDKNGIIKSQTSESFWYKSVSTYNKEGNFEGLQIKSTVYDLSIKKIGKKVAPKVADVWLGKNKRINVYFQNYGLSQSLLTAFPK